MTWDEYKKNIKDSDPLAKQDIVEAEACACQSKSSLDKQNVRLRQARIKLGLSESYVSKAAGIEEEDLAQMERGFVAVTPEQFQRLCALYRLTGDDFFSKDEENDLIFKGDEGISEHDKQELDKLVKFKKKWLRMSKRISKQ